MLTRLVWNFKEILCQHVEHIFGLLTIVWLINKISVNKQMYTVTACCNWLNWSQMIGAQLIAKESETGCFGNNALLYQIISSVSKHICLHIYAMDTIFEYSSKCTCSARSLNVTIRQKSQARFFVRNLFTRTIVQAPKSFKTNTFYVFNYFICCPLTF